MKCPKCGQEMKKSKGDYIYKESGLDNVRVKNINLYHCSCGIEIPGLKNIEGLHRVIARFLVKKKTPLTGKEIRFLRKEIGLRAKDLATMLGVSPVTVSRWETDTEKPEISKDKLIRLLYIQKMQEQRKEVFQGSFEGLKSITSKKYEPMKIAVPSTYVRDECEAVA